MTKNFVRILFALYYTSFFSIQEVVSDAIIKIKVVSHYKEKHTHTPIQMYMHFLLSKLLFQELNQSQFQDSQIKFSLIRSNESGLLN